MRVGVIERITLTTPAYSSLLRMTGEPVVVKISGVYLLVDKSVQTPEEVRCLCGHHHHSEPMMVAGLCRAHTHSCVPSVGGAVGL